jgi:DUF4097 and DUF4098 domain-containing protein YvlB
MRTTVFVCAVLVALLVCQPAAARMIDKNYHETFDVEEGIKLILLHGDGDVVITPWDQDVIDVKIRYHANVTSVGFGVEVDFNADFKQAGDAVIVKGSEGGTAGIFFLRSTNEYEYTYTISAPSYVILELRGDDGDVELSGWRAGVDCELDDGDVSMDGVVGGIEIDLEDGDVKLTGLVGELAVRGDDGDVTVSESTLKHAFFSLEDGSIDVMDSAGQFEVTVDDGDVDFRRVTAGIVDIRGNDGDVDLDLKVDAEAHINVATDDGDVTMRLSGELSFDYLVTMDDGDVDIHLDGVTDTETDDHRVSGTVGGGAGHVRVRTSDGDVTIVSGG